jgi:hypothetical protein
VAVAVAVAVAVVVTVAVSVAVAVSAMRSMRFGSRGSQVGSVEPRCSSALPLPLPLPVTVAVAVAVAVSSSSGVSPTVGFCLFFFVVFISKFIE